LSVLRSFIKYVARASEWSGKAVAWLMIPLVFELVYDTAARYVFNAPTVWSFDLSYMLYGILFMVGGAYTLLDEAHIRIEVFYDLFSERVKAITDVIGYLVFFFPAIGALFYYGIFYAAESWETLERATSSYWSPPVYHFKTVIPVAALLLLLQGIAKFINAVAVIIRGKEL
jgi:TRAP-type mannitol/chloroaromatic compound transport system permease small subunit